VVEERQESFLLVVVLVLVQLVLSPVIENENENDDEDDWLRGLLRQELRRWGRPGRRFGLRDSERARVAISPERGFQT